MKLKDAAHYLGNDVEAKSEAEEEGDMFAK